MSVDFFKLIRWKNLLLIALMQFLITRFILDNFNIINLFLLVTTLLITASGYIINDYFDITSDSINKPSKQLVGKSISKKQTIQYYIVSLFLGLSSGFYLSYIAGKPLYVIYFILISLLLYLYSKYLKGTPLVGNITVSVLLSFSVYIIVLFNNSIDLIAEKTYHVSIILTYTVFAFLLNLIREIIKDIEDIKGDMLQNIKTLPITFGINKAKNIIVIICNITLLFSFFIFYYTNNTGKLIVLFTVIIPIFIFIFKLLKATKKYDFKKLSTYIKLIIFVGILTIPIISYYI